MTAARLAAALLLAAIVALALTAPAEAALNLCNRTSYILYAAAGYKTGRTAVTRGWTRIVPGSCATAIEGPLAAKPYYVYARTSQAHDGPAHAWGGDTAMCVKDTGFTLRTAVTAGGCENPDAFTVPFMRIDTKSSPSWTTTFTGTPPFASAAAARKAGITRLLSDAGYDHAGAKGAAAALEKFRSRMRIPATASNADLFDALETEALKVAAPAGYSICNDTNEDLWAAIGLKLPVAWTSRGWWKVAPGSCARALTTKLTTDKVYLLAETASGKRLVSGKEDFCITHITFEVQRRSQCKERGLKAAGFAATDTGGRGGYAAHIAEDGLLPPLRPLLR